MKYQCSIEINESLAKVVEYWDNPDLFSNWQDGFQNIEILEGTKNSVGAKSKILFKQGKRELELIETILTNDLPNQKKALYEHVHMTNTQTTKFEVIDAKTTRYVSEVEYTQFNGFMPKMMAKLFPKMFKKQSQKWMDQFKIFVEESN